MVDVREKYFSSAESEVYLKAAGFEAETAASAKTKTANRKS